VPTVDPAVNADTTTSTSAMHDAEPESTPSKTCRRDLRLIEPRGRARAAQAASGGEMSGGTSSG
jgi:hypothetical protein